MYETVLSSEEQARLRLPPLNLNHRLGARSPASLVSGCLHRRPSLGVLSLGGDR